MYILVFFYIKKKTRKQDLLAPPSLRFRMDWLLEVRNFSAFLVCTLVVDAGLQPRPKTNIFSGNCNRVRYCQTELLSRKSCGLSKRGVVHKVGDRIPLDEVSWATFVRTFSLGIERAAVWAVRNTGSLTNTD